MKVVATTKQGNASPAFFMLIFRREERTCVVKGSNKKIFNKVCEITGATYLKGFRNPVIERKDGYMMYILFKSDIKAVLFDREDISTVGNDRTWIGRINGSGDKIYVGCAGGLTLHRLITKCPDNLVVDHINGNTFDNRRCNLRCVTPGVNMLNKKLYDNNNTGVTNIRQISDTRYALNITRQFADIETAIAAKHDIQAIIDHYSNIDAEHRIYAS